MRFQATFLISVVMILQPRAYAETPPAVVRVCVECHGLQGRAQVPGWPSLVSMSYEEIKQKLIAYRAQRIPDSRMTEVAHILDDKDIDTVARFYGSEQANELSQQRRASEAPDG